MCNRLSLSRSIHLLYLRPFNKLTQNSDQFTFCSKRTFQLVKRMLRWKQTRVQEQTKKIYALFAQDRMFSTILFVFISIRVEQPCRIDTCSHIVCFLCMKKWLEHGMHCATCREKPKEFLIVNEGTENEFRYVPRKSFDLDTIHTLIFLFQVPNRGSRKRKTQKTTRRGWKQYPTRQ